MKQIAQTIASKVNALGFTKNDKPMVVDQGEEIAAAIAGCRNAHVLRTLLGKRPKAEKVDLMLVPDHPEQCDGSDFIMKAGATGIWITVDGFSVHICRGTFPQACDGGLRVFVYKQGEADHIESLVMLPDLVDCQEPSDVFVIYSRSEAAAGCSESDGFWSNNDGWGSGKTATFFTDAEKVGFSLPVSAGADACWLPRETAEQMLLNNQSPQVDMEDAVAEWVGLHYGRNFSTETPEKKKEWVERFTESHSEESDSEPESDSFENHYLCPCGNEWIDTWSSACNDKCSSCNREIEPYASDDGSMSPEEIDAKLQEIVKSRKYLVASAWGHIFEGIGERHVRFVFEVASKSITRMQLLTGVKGWLNAPMEMVADVQDSLINGNEEALDDPSNYGLQTTGELPEWASEL